MTLKKLTKDAKILIIDDDNIIIEWLKITLTKSYFKGNFYIAKNGKEGFNELLKHFEENIPVDLVFSDICMPEYDGISFLKMLKAHPKLSQITPVFMVTANSEKESIDTCLEKGAIGHIKKGEKNKKILLKIKNGWNKFYNVSDN